MDVVAFPHFGHSAFTDPADENVLGDFVLFLQRSTLSSAISSRNWLKKRNIKLAAHSKIVFELRSYFRIMEAGWQSRLLLFGWSVEESFWSDH